MIVISTLSPRPSAEGMRHDSYDPHDPPVGLPAGDLRFHRQLGFDIETGDAQVDGAPVMSGYDGAGQDRVRLVKHLAG